MMPIKPPEQTRICDVNAASRATIFGLVWLSLWRLRFDDGVDDLLFRMAVADGKVVGALVGPTFI